MSWWAQGKIYPRLPTFAHLLSKTDGMAEMFIISSSLKVEWVNSYIYAFVFSQVRATANELLVVKV